jgi:hypothetical protein
VVLVIEVSRTVVDVLSRKGIDRMILLGRKARGRLCITQDAMTDSPKAAVRNDTTGFFSSMRARHLQV